MTKTEILFELKNRNFQFYNLEIGLDEFFTWYESCLGSTAEGQPLLFREFKWRNEEGDSVTAEIAISHREIEEDTFEITYQLR